jgi:hypothetical protein
MNINSIPTDLRDKAGAIFSSSTTMATPALVLGIQLFDEDILEWDPVFVEEAILKHLRVSINEDVMQRLQAATTLILNPDSFFKEPEIFHIVCASLLDPDSVPEQMSTAPSPVELAWSCMEAQSLLGDIYSSSLYSPQVRRYCGAALMYEGLYTAPPVLAFADFPEDRYPTTIVEDEVLSQSFAREQQILTSDIESSLMVLKQLYRQQLAQLSVFGGDAEAFKKLQ